MSEERVVLTTGANSGIGLATALEVARRGFRSVGTVRSPDKAEVVAKAAAANGVSVETALLDVTDADGCAEVVDRFCPYGLVNNAGYSITGAVEDVLDDEARHALETMVVAPMRLARLSLPHMRAGGGRIVNVSSVMGITSTALTGWYQAAKHALEAVTDALRVEVASDGIRVVLVEPGGFRTGIWEEGRQEVARRQGSRYTQAYERGLRGTRWIEPLMGDPARVATTIASILGSARPRARYLVGYDAQMLAWAERLTVPAVKDTVIRRFLGL
jgi:NAD(P)-dependent dehydrogenase (short-subunit alcohol dehydrogenase family)